jgi:hypothetical protein
MSSHNKDHDQAVLQILGYLKKHPNWGVGFTTNSGDVTDLIYIHLASDSSFADVLPTRESSTCYMSFINHCCFQLKSGKTPGVCHDVHEAEYNAFFKAGGQFKFISQIFNEMGIEIVRPVPIALDSASAKKTLESHKVTQRSKHIDMRCHATWELVQSNQIDPRKVPTEENPADIGTKPYTLSGLKIMRPQIMMHIKE